MTPHAWLQWTVVALALLAAGLSPAARALAGPHGATVHVRWQPSVTEPERQEAEARFRLADGERLDQDTWRYDLIDPSRDNIRALVLEPAIADTHNIDRPNNALDPSASRTARRQRFLQGDRVVASADRLAIALAGAAALLTLIAVTRRMPATRALRLRVQRIFQPPAHGTEVAEDRSHDRPRLWTAAVLAASAPFVIILCLTLWRTPFPLTEAVALFEDIEEQSIARFFDPNKAYYRPLSYLTVSALWYHAGSLDATLAAIKLLTIVPLLLLVVLFVIHLRPRTALEAAAAGLAVAVLTGSPGFRDNLEIGIPDTIVGMFIALLVWIVLNRERRIWHAPLIVACTLIAIGFKEQGLVLVPLGIAAWWTRAPSAGRGVAVTLAIIGVAYVALRLSARAVWLPFEQDVGLGFTELELGEAAARFGAFPYWLYAYSGASTIANILFAEPARGVFRIVHAAIEGRTEPWHIIHVGSSVALTGVIAWWGFGALRRTAQGGWSPESRLFVVMALMVLATGALSFNYSRERLGGIAVVFYAIAAFFAVRTAAARLADAPRVKFVIAGLGLALLAAAWQTRAMATSEYARVHSWGNQREWFDRLPMRRIEYAHRKVYVGIMESMVEQGTYPAAPRPTRFPDWVSRTLGQP